VKASFAEDESDHGRRYCRSSPCQSAAIRATRSHTEVDEARATAIGGAMLVAASEGSGHDECVHAMHLFGFPSSRMRSS
jgi:hypothetical protein